MTEPGWYPDPEGASRARYWDGSSWTQRTRALDGGALADGPGRAPDPGDRSPGSGGGSWFRRPVTWVAVSVVVVLGLVAGVLFVVVGDDEAAAGEVILEPADDDGEDPFFASVATSEVEIEGGGVEEVAGSADGVESLSGATPGLYGGTGDDAVCDQDALVGFLEDDAEKAAAFASVLEIASDDIAEYVAGLTQVLLREDTRVTNHGFAQGRAVARQAVFQAGTAVLVDDLGVPRVRCACGNPLTEPQATAGTPSFAGDRWSTFDDSRLVAVGAAGEPQTSFELVDVRTGEPYTITTGDDMNVLTLTADGLILPGDGATLMFGQARSEVVAALTQVLGTPSEDLLGVVRWDGLTLSVSADLFESWIVSSERFDEQSQRVPADGPPAETPEGVGIGSNAEALWSAYPDLQIWACGLPDVNVLLAPAEPGTEGRLFASGYEIGFYDGAVSEIIAPGVPDESSVDVIGVCRVGE